MRKKNQKGKKAINLVRPEVRRMVSIWIAIFAVVTIVPAIVLGSLIFSNKLSERKNAGKNFVDIPAAVQSGDWISGDTARRYKEMDANSAESISPEEGKCLAEEVVSPLIHYVRTRYPIAHIRSELERVHGALPIVVTAAPETSSFAFTAYADPDCKQAAIFINAANFRVRLRWAMNVFGPEQGKRYMEDLLSTMILHEGYHALNQHFIGKAEAEKVYQYESECWIYTCQLFDQLSQKGRGAELFRNPASLEMKIYSQYLQTGKPQKPTLEWSAFVKKCYCIP